MNALKHLFAARKMLTAMLAFSTFAAVADDDVAAQHTAHRSTAIVVEDQVLLRAEPRDSSPHHATLWEGDVLEVRGERMDYLQVYNHRRERAGFVRASQVRVVDLSPTQAPTLLAVVRFLIDSPDDEALGIAYAATYLQAADAADIDAEIFHALGQFADRLAQRGSSPRKRASAEIIAAHLDVAASFGVVVRSFENAGRMQLCYDGEAMRRVMALPATPLQQANAALALTRPECVDPDQTPMQRYATDEWRADVLERVPLTSLPTHIRNRLNMRRAAANASLAFALTRLNKSGVAAANLALEALANVDKLHLGEQDTEAYADAAVRVGASRWAGMEAPAAASGTELHAASGLALHTANGEPGQTCIRVVDKQHGEKSPLLTHCTYATVWTQSARANASGDVITLAVQPLHSWRELMVLQRTPNGWQVEVVPPADVLDVGYVEFAGWIPGSRQILAARESRKDGRFGQRFEIISLDRMLVEKHADKPEYLSLFYRWQDPQWKQETVSLR